MSFGCSFSKFFKVLNEKSQANLCKISSEIKLLFKIREIVSSFKTPSIPPKYLRVFFLNNLTHSVGYVLSASSVNFLFISSIVYSSSIFNSNFSQKSLIPYSQKPNFLACLKFIALLE